MGAAAGSTDPRTNTLRIKGDSETMQELAVAVMKIDVPASHAFAPTGKRSETVRDAARRREPGD